MLKKFPLLVDFMTELKVTFTWDEHVQCNTMYSEKSGTEYLSLSEY